jgi:uncharacterized protein YecA (UPF0149 family)
MGAIADAMVRFAQPLIDASDGSPEQVQRALMLSQLCWNLAVMLEQDREEFLANMQPAPNMNDEEFQEFKRDIVAPMIRRHEQMFPGMRPETPLAPSPTDTAQTVPPPAPRIRVEKKYPGTGRNERCPCGSGRKYKVCCGR